MYKYCDIYLSINIQNVWFDFSTVAIFYLWHICKKADKEEYGLLGKGAGRSQEWKRSDTIYQSLVVYFSCCFYFQEAEKWHREVEEWKVRWPTSKNMECYTKVRLEVLFFLFNHIFCLFIYLSFSCILSENLPLGTFDFLHNDKYYRCYKVVEPAFRSNLGPSWMRISSKMKNCIIFLICAKY